MQNKISLFCLSRYYKWPLRQRWKNAGVGRNELYLCALVFHLFENILHSSNATLAL